MSKHDLFFVAGPGGGSGTHLVKKLREDGFEKIRAVDQKPISEWCAVSHDVENLSLDLKKSVLINSHLLLAAQQASASRFFFASSVFLYNAEKQADEDVRALKEEDAYPVLPEDGSGFAKLFSERMCRHFREDFVLATRIARSHKVYGPHGTYDVVCKKAPAAICRKVVEAKLADNDKIESGAIAIKPVVAL